MMRTKTSSSNSSSVESLRYAGAPEIWTNAHFESILDYLKLHIVVRDRTHRLKKYKDCFTGRDMVSVLMEGFHVPKRELAARICELLRLRKAIEPASSNFTANGSRLFKDKARCFYVFSDTPINADVPPGGTKFTRLAHVFSDEEIARYKERARRHYEETVRKEESTRFTIMSHNLSPEQIASYKEKAKRKYLSTLNDDLDSSLNFSTTDIISEELSASRITLNTSSKVFPVKRSASDVLTFDSPPMIIRPSSSSTSLRASMKGGNQLRSVSSNTSVGSDSEKSRSAKYVRRGRAFTSAFPSTKSSKMKSSKPKRRSHSRSATLVLDSDVVGEYGTSLSSTTSSFSSSDWIDPSWVPEVELDASSNAIADENSVAMRRLSLNSSSSSVR